MNERRIEAYLLEEYYPSLIVTSN